MRRSLINEAVQKEFEENIQNETENFLNKIFNDQIEFFNKVKMSLPANSKRVQDIESYVEKLQVAIQETDVSKKDDIYFGTFQSVIIKCVLIAQQLFYRLIFIDWPNTVNNKQY